MILCVCSQGGDVLQETITSNVTEDVVTLEFQRSDGTLVTQLIDFRKVSLHCETSFIFRVRMVFRMH